MSTNRSDKEHHRPVSVDSIPKKVLPEVKITGQPLGEDGVEKTEEETAERERDPDQRKHREDDKEEPFDKQGLPISEPPTEGKYSI